MDEGEIRAGNTHLDVRFAKGVASADGLLNIQEGR